MTRLIDRDFMDVLLVTRAALEHNDLDEMRREVLKHLDRIFKCDKSTFFLAAHGWQTLDFDGVVSHGFDKDYMQQFIDYYYQLDPYVPGLRFRPPVIVTEQIISFKDLVQTEYYNDFLKPQNIHYQMAMILKSGHRLVGALAFLRPPGASNFLARDMDKAELMALYLSEIVNKNILLHQMIRQTAAFEFLATGMPLKGEMVLDESLAPVRVDEKVKKLFVLIAGGEPSRAEVPVKIPEPIRMQCEKLLQSVRRSKEVETSARLKLELDQIRQPLKVGLRLVGYEDEKPTFQVSLEQENPIAVLQERWVELGLTKREVEVAHLVCRGLKNSEISDKLYISPYTVENHLKSIYAKAGVGNRTRLTHKLLSM
ncbi:MAG: helix-turn-helix transcriptional regulator [Desulfobacterales bacterium]|nr:MAG: helix-turn-helix transcriptional regulator [Desulfobacterales bacterium]